MGLQSNHSALQRFRQSFALDPEGSFANKLSVHNDVFRYRDEVFGGFVTEPQEESEEEVEEPEERQQTPEVVPDDSGAFYDQTVSNDLEEHLEEPAVELEPELEPELCQTFKRTSLSLHWKKLLLRVCRRASTSRALEDMAPAQEDVRTFSWASVTSKNLPPSGTVPVMEFHITTPSRI